MKIIRGELKGRVYSVSKFKGLRITEGKVREALWSILDPLPRGSFLDLFSGSGIVAFEAISMGFNPVEAVEIEKKLCENIEKTSIELGVDLRVYRSDAILFLKKTNKKYAYIFLDPPYNFPKIPTVLSLSLKKLEDNGILILENVENFKYHIEPFKFHKFGKTCLYFFKKN